MRSNILREIWGSGGAVVNGWLAIPSSFSAEVMAHAGWDSLTIDMQHGVQDYSSAIFILQAISTTRTAPMARVPWNEPGIIMKMLDAGCYGIICPMVNNAAEARAFVSACRYPPAGTRSFGPIRALMYGGSDYAAHANEEIVALAMIETRQALDNLEEILATPGVDGVYIGPADLSLSLGCAPRFDQDERPVVEAIELVVRRTRERGLVAGIHNGSADYAGKMIEAGFQFITIASDVRILAAGAAQIITKLRSRPTPSRDAIPY